MHFAVLGHAESWYCNEITEAALKRGIRCSRIEFSALTAHLGNRLAPALSASQLDLTEVDALIVRTMPPGSLEQVVFRMDALHQLQAAGLLIINSPKAIECAVDKYRTTALLDSAGLKVPETLVCESFEEAMQAFELLGGDVVVKPLFGAEGRGIVRVSHPEMALRTFRTLTRLNTVLYVQRYIQHNGSDIRILVLNGKILGAMRRSNSQDFRVNISCKGTAEKYHPSNEELDWAVQAAEVTETCFAGVDLLYNEQGECHIIEVNAVPGWQAFAKVNQIDVADTLLNFLVKSVS